MKKIYAEKINRMRISSISRVIAIHFAEHEGLVVTNDDIVELTGLDKVKARNLVSSLNQSGWIIQNIAPKGHEAKWILKGVTNRKGGKPKMVMPKLNPLIELVFR